MQLGVQYTMGVYNAAGYTVYHGCVQCSWVYSIPWVCTMQLGVQYTMGVYNAAGYTVYHGCV